MDDNKHDLASTAAALWELTLHVLLIAAAFVVIFGIAVVLDQGVAWLISIRLLESNTVLWYVILIGKYAILAADLVLILVLLAKNLWRIGIRI